MNHDEIARLRKLLAEAIDNANATVEYRERGMVELMVLLIETNIKLLERLQMPAPHPELRLGLPLKRQVH